MITAAAKANNLSFEETEQIYRGMVAAGVAFGGSQADLDAIIRATTQVLSKGKVTAEEMQGQIGERLPGAVAKFAAAGKRIRKKDLGMIAISYGYVYVAQVAMGANQAQYMKAIKEAEAYPGPSLIIAYSPCISHGLKASMGKSQAEEKKAVEAGYWQMYRNNPALENEGKNPFTLDSKEPKWENFQDFLLGEVRYTSLQKSFPEQAKELFAAAEENAKWRYKTYKRQAAMDYSEEKELV